MKHLSLFVLLGLIGMACSNDVERPLAPPPGPPTYPTEISTAHLGSIESDHLDEEGKATRVRCATCHDVADVGQRAESPTELKDFHQGLVFSHGTLSCNACHSDERPDRLRLATGKTIDSTEALTLCSQCHGPQRKSYDHGAHGGMNGHWDLSRGPRLRNHCVDCHNPHVPQISRVTPAPGPRDRGQLPVHILEDSH